LRIGGARLVGGAFRLVPEGVTSVVGFSSVVCAPVQHVVLVRGPVAGFVLLTSSGASAQAGVDLLKAFLFVVGVGVSIIKIMCVVDVFGEFRRNFIALAPVPVARVGLFGKVQVGGVGTALIVVAGVGTIVGNRGWTYEAFDFHDSSVLNRVRENNSPI